MTDSTEATSGDSPDHTAVMEGVPLQVTVSIPLDRLFPSLTQTFTNVDDGPEPTSNSQELIEAVAQILVRELSTEYRYGLREQVKRVALQIVTDQVTEMVATILNEDVTPTDGLGNALGMTKPFRSIIMEAATKWAGEKSDYRSPTNLEKVIASEVATQFTAAARSAIETSRTQITEVLSQRAAQILAESIEDVTMTDVMAAAKHTTPPPNV